jgi:hypothetical protein
MNLKKEDSGIWEKSPKKLFGIEKMIPGVQKQNKAPVFKSKRNFETSKH